MDGRVKPSQAKPSQASASRYAYTLVVEVVYRKNLAWLGRVSCEQSELPGSKAPFGVQMAAGKREPSSEEAEVARLVIDLRRLSPPQNSGFWGAKSPSGGARSSEGT